MSDLADRLEVFLTNEWSTEVRVSDFQPVTAGARRLNALFTAHRDGDSEKLVLTLVPGAEMQANPIAIETGMLRLAEQHGVTVAHVHVSSDDANHLGGPFFISSQVTGETIPRRVIRLADQTPGLGAKVARQCGEGFARLHHVDTASVTGLGVEPVTSATDEALSYTDDLLRELLEPSIAFTLVQRWLERHRPADSAVVPIHGDIRNGNIIVNEDGLGAILDWEVAALGDPYQDLAWMAQRMWRAGNDHLEIGGFAKRSDLQAGYEAAGGSWDANRFEWWKVYRTQWWGLTLAAQARHHLDGSFRSIVMAASGRRVAELEWDALQLISPTHQPLNRSSF